MVIPEGKPWTLQLVTAVLEGMAAELVAVPDTDGVAVVWTVWLVDVVELLATWPLTVVVKVMVVVDVASVFKSMDVGALETVRV